MSFNAKSSGNNLAKGAIFIAILIVIASITNLNKTKAASAVSIDNAGFEDGMSGWTEVEPSAISDLSNNGSKSLKINASPGRVHQVVNVSPSTQYTLSAYVLGKGRIGVNDGLGNYKSKSFDVSKWTKVSKTFTTSSATTSTQVFAKHHRSSDSVRFDDFELIKEGNDNSDTDDTFVPDNDIIAEDFNNNEGCFSYKDNLFYNTSQSDYASGSRINDALSVQLGGKNNDDINNMSGGWRCSFSLSNATALSIQFDYDIDAYRGYESDEYSKILLSVDDKVYDIVKISGGGSEQKSRVQIDTSKLSSGNHTIIFGGFNNKKTHNREATVIQFDNVVVSATDTNTPATPEPQPTATPRPTATSIPPTNDCAEIPSSITNNSLWDLEGENPHPLVHECRLEFVPLQAKVTTPNGNGWRHEYKIASDRRISMTDTYEAFKATIKVDMSDGGKTIVAQHHASDTGTIMKLYIADSNESGFKDSKADNGIFDVYVRIRGTDGNEEKKALGTIRSGDSFSFHVINNYGTVKVEAFGDSFELEVQDSSESYLKFGNYLQSQDPYTVDDCGKSGDSDSFKACYDDLNINVAKVTMTDVSYSRQEK